MTTQRLTIERPSPFRRRRFVVPHRRRSRTLMLLKPFVLALLVVGLPLAAVMWVSTSPLFLLAEVQIGHTSRVPTAAVATALAPLQGRHLLTLSLADVEALLVENPWIEGAAIRKELPNRLMVEIRERVPAALLRQEEGIVYVDRSGFVIGPYDPDGPVDLPLLSLAGSSVLEVDAVLGLAARIDSLAPSLGRGLSEIEILGGGDYRIFSSALPFPIVGSATDVESQLRKLDRVLPDIQQHYPAVTSVDLRFTRQIIIQPARVPRSQEG